MGPRIRTLAHGAIAGAVGTAALNASTYLDMAVRGRPASTTPDQMAQRLLDALHLGQAADEETRQARSTGLGAFLGMSAGVSVGVLLAQLRSAGHPRGAVSTAATSWAIAMLVGNGPMTLVGVTDPRAWTADDWLTDVLPHLAYAAASAGTLAALEG